LNATIELFAREPRARWFFAALLQSSLGTGAAYVALLLIAYERWHSPWAITLVLLADLLPAMLLGPVFGAAADRWSRKWCTVAADLLRCAAFVGIAVTDSIALTLAFALVAGSGTGLFTPAALASLPGLVERQRLPSATSAYGAVGEVGFTLGPAVAAIVLLFGTPEQLIGLNGLTFGISAIVLGNLSFGQAPAATDASRASLFREAASGMAATAGITGVRALLGVSAGALFFAGLFNVAELPFAQDILDSGEVGYSVLATAFGIGFVVGSLTASGGGAPVVLKARYRLGLLILATGFLASGLAPGYAAALGAFALGGIGNGMLIVYERQLIQVAVPDHLAGRVFGVKDALSAWAFGLAFVCAGGLITLIGVRELLVAAGVGGMVAWVTSLFALQGAFTEEGAVVRDRLGARAEAFGDRRAGQEGPDLVGGGHRHGSAGLDQGGERLDHSGVELGPSTGA
jgi:Major Facilitator Superfamily